MFSQESSLMRLKSMWTQGFTSAAVLLSVEPDQVEDWYV